jgi:hypothetical protein
MGLRNGWSMFFYLNKNQKAALRRLAEIPLTGTDGYFFFPPPHPPFSQPMASSLFFSNYQSAPCHFGFWSQKSSINFMKTKFFHAELDKQVKSSSRKTAKYFRR